MMFRFFESIPLTVPTCLILTSLIPLNVSGQDSQLDTAMGIKPKHLSEVEIEMPGIAVLKDCQAVRTQSPSGFIVHHSSGRILRQFVDSNGDGKLDRWSYYNNGLEVYRDIDSDFNGRLDQYRWLATEGTRWGIDSNQDGQIDSWKSISPEEVAYECFQAIKEKDQDRFRRLLLSEEELKNLGLNDKIGAEISTRWKRAQSEFLKFCSSQKVIDKNATWVYSGNGQPAMLAAGNGNKNDIVVYDHASGFFSTGGEVPQQLALGSIVQVGQAWRMVELPEIVDPSKPLANGGAFFPMPEYGLAGAESGIDKEMAELFEQLAEVETKLESAEGLEAEKFEKQKADVLAQIYETTKDPKNRLDWIKNLADSVSSAYQADRFQKGIDYLNDFIRKNREAEGIDYVKWRAIFAEYGWYTQNGDRKQQENARDKLIGELKDFQKTYPRSNFSADALIQLAVHAEVSTDEDIDQAEQWYKLCANRFPETSYGRRAQGAMVRLNSLGKTFPFESKTATGQKFDLRSKRGKIVVLHYWETWCCSEDDIEALAKLQEKYKDDLEIIGCNIEGFQMGETDPELQAEKATAKFKEFYNDNRSKMTWLQLHEPGGVDSSPLAHQLGVSLEPTVALVDAEGQLVDANIAIADLDREIERERRRK